MWSKKQPRMLRATSLSIREHVHSSTFELGSLIDHVTFNIKLLLRIIIHEIE